MEVTKVKTSERKNLGIQDIKFVIIRTKSYRKASKK